MTHTPMLDVERCRAELPATGRSAYLNTGTAGPLPAAAIAAAVRLGAEELAGGRATMDYILWYRAQLARLRERLAGFVGADVDEIALTHNTTEGMTSPCGASNGSPATRSSPRRWSTRAASCALSAASPPRRPDHVRGRGRRRARPHARGARPCARPRGQAARAVAPGLEHRGDPPARADRRARARARGAGARGRRAVRRRDPGRHARPGCRLLRLHRPEVAVRTARDGRHVRPARPARPAAADVHRLRRHRLPAYVPTTWPYAPAHGAQRYEVAASYVPSMGALEASVAWLSDQGPIFERIAALGARCRAAVAELPAVEALDAAGPTPGSSRSIAASTATRASPPCTRGVSTSARSRTTERCGSHASSSTPRPRSTAPSSYPRPSRGARRERAGAVRRRAGRTDRAAPAARLNALSLALLDELIAAARRWIASPD